MKKTANLYRVILIFSFIGCASPSRTPSQTAAKTCSVAFGNAQAHTQEAGVCRIDFKASRDPVLLSWPLGRSLKRNQLIELEVMLSSIADIEGIEFRLFNGKNRDQFSVYKTPLFAQESFNFVQSKVPTKITMGMGHFQGAVRDNYETLGVFIQPKGTQAFTVSLGQLQVKAKSYFGQGRISITFDDGYKSLLDADKILKKQGLGATAFIIYEALGQKGYLTKDQVCGLKNNGWAISSHATLPFTQTPQLDQFLKSDFKNMKTLCGGKLPIEHVAYPLGEHNQEIINTVKKYYLSARLAAGGLETLPAANNYKLRAVNVTPQVTPQEILAMAESAVQSGDWLILMFHYLWMAPKPRI